MPKVKYLYRIDMLDTLSGREREALKAVAERYAFRANDYYLSLIDWNDPEDPIRRIVVPLAEEMESYGQLDASREGDYYEAPGCQHKYEDTALLLVNEVCGAYCRFCFRKRLFMQDNEEVEYDVRPGIEYIRSTPAISNVLLTGGDPLLLSNRRLGDILAQLRSIEHVRIIRIGTKMPAFNPFRISEDPELLEILARHSGPAGRIYVMCHYNHPRELTEPSRMALDALLKAGVVLTNQTPMIRGVNDDARVLADLMRELSYAGVPPYYFFQCRPTEGNKPFDLPIVRSWLLLQEAMSRVSGLAARARLAMSHHSGKVVVEAVTESSIVCRYHRARHARDDGRVMVFPRDDGALWLDDLFALGEKRGDRSRQHRTTEQGQKRKPSGWDGYPASDSGHHD